jgi:hypothetical protein
MELYNSIITIVDVNLIYCLIPIILTLTIIELIFKNRFETTKALNLIRGVIIFYTIITSIKIAFDPIDATFINRATGPNNTAYWIMFLSTLILPFTLLFKKLGAKFWYVLFIAFSMKIGVYFERFVIITTSVHRDYLTENKPIEFSDSISFGIVMLFLQGIIIAILTLGVFEITRGIKTMRNSSYT